jgi:hypothetical protein
MSHTDTAGLPEPSALLRAHENGKGAGRRALLPAGGVLAVEAPRDAVGGRTSRRVIRSRARSSCPPMIFDVTPSG